MTKYYLCPTSGQKSFYGKAYVVKDDYASETLYSYDTPIIRRTAAGRLIRLWYSWSATTGKHIKAFCGLNKAQYESLPMERND